MSEGAERLDLKWGTLKGWDLKSDKALDLIKRYHEYDVAWGCAQQRDTPEQKQIICDLIDAVDGPVWNDWDGKVMTKDEAKQYVINYGAKK
jgi:hypothetical protein